MNNKFFPLIKKLLYGLEYIIFGGTLRERCLLYNLRNYYNSKFRREWNWSKNPPSFENQRIFNFNFAFTEKNYGPYFLFRGFYSSELIRNNDRVLDIGCGDGFLTKRFYSKKALVVDAIDFDNVALNCACKQNFSHNIIYSHKDAVNDDFPNTNYNVVIWDGALGHFDQDSINKILNKISQSLVRDGIFCGSESMGPEGDDHLYIIDKSNDLLLLFKPFFRYIQFKEIQYELEWTNGFIRKEIFWRCSNETENLKELDWEKHYQENSRGEINEY